MSAGSWRSAPLPPGWGRLRMTVLARDPVCQWGMLPGEQGPCGAASTEADHMGPPGDHRVEMLRGICRPHHIQRSGDQGRAAKALLASRRLLPVEPHPGFVREGDALLCLHSFQYKRSAPQAMARRHARHVTAWAASTHMPVPHAMARVLSLRTGNQGTGQCPPKVQVQVQLRLRQRMVVERVQSNNTATATGPAPSVNAGAGNKYRHLGVRVGSGAPDCVVNLETSPDGSTWAVADSVTGGGGRWAMAGLNVAAQYARANVVNLGAALAGRSDAGCSTNSTTTVTDPVADASDGGKSISGPGIPAAATIVSVSPGVGYVISAAATATASALTFIVGAGVLPISTTLVYTS